MTPEERDAFKKDLLAEMKTTVVAVVTEAVKPIADQQKVLADTLEQLPPAGVGVAKGGKKGDAAAAPAAAAALDADGIKKLVQETVTGALTQQQEQTRTAQQREAFVGQHLAKLPAAYKAKLGNDPAKWADEAKAIQTEFEADLKGLGVKVEAVGNAARTDGGTPAAAARPDLSKLSPMQKIERGLAASPAAAATAAAAAAK